MGMTHFSKKRDDGMRILHIGKYFPPSPGGIENFSSDLIHALTRRGLVNAALVHADPLFPVDNKPAAHEMTAHEMPHGAPAKEDIWIHRVPSVGPLLYTPVSLGFPLALHRAIKGFKPDLLYFHMPNVSAFNALFLPRAWTLPWALDWHSDVVSSKIDWRLAVAYPAYFPFEQAMIAKAGAVVVHSQPYLDSSLPLKPWRRKCVVAPLGIDPERILGKTPKGNRPKNAPETRPKTGGQTRQQTHRQTRKKNSRTTIPGVIQNFWKQEGPFRLLAAGRLSYYKGHDVLIRATSQLKNVSTVIAGDGERFDELTGIIRETGAGQRVSLTGHVSDETLSWLMKRCHCLCVPSVERTEAFGMVILEAMSLGKPVIASDIPGSGIGFAVANGQTGLLVPPGNINRLKAACQWMMENREMARQMGAAGKKRFDALFHIDAIAEKIDPILHKIIKKKQNHHMKPKT